MEFLAHLLIYLITGCISGFLAGLFGVGGGIIIVPVFTLLFSAMGFAPSVIMPLTIGSSMAIVSVTSVFSARTHHQHNNVDWVTAKKLWPTVLLGVVLGAWLGSTISRSALVGSVIAFELTVACWFLWQCWHTEGHGEGPSAKKPWTSAAMMLVALPLGSISSLVGIAGGTLFVPFLTLAGVGMRKAIGTAAALGIPISVVAASVYIVTGLSSGKLLPDYALGFVYLPAFAGCVLGSFSTAPYGAALAKKMNLRKLKFTFALVLLAAAGKMLFL